MPPRLTEKQQTFVAEFVETGNAAGAALAAYNTTPLSAKTMGRDLLKQPKIKAEICRLIGEKVSPEAIAQLFQQWIHSEDGNIAHKWLMTYLEYLEPLVKKSLGKVEQHLHIEMPGAVRRFVLANGRFPTVEEAERLEREEKWEKDSCSADSSSRPSKMQPIQVEATILEQ